MSIDFTIAFVCHDGIDILKKTLPQNINSLCKFTNETYDLLLVIDGVETVNYKPLIDLAFSYGINEVRMRTRVKNCATGDPSNNGHYHLFSNKTKYLISFEEDVALFNLNYSFDILHNLKILFENHSDMCLASKMDDHDCWVWKLKNVGVPFEAGYPRVNRVSSHFLVYDTQRCDKMLSISKFKKIDLFFDNGNSWLNYEDFLSKNFAKNSSSMICNLDAFPIKVFHCDSKINKSSPYYTKSKEAKINIFNDIKNQLDVN